MSVDEFFRGDIELFDFTDEIMRYKTIRDKELKDEYLNKDIKTFKKYILYKTILKNSDPDTNEGLLKDIYKVLWDEEYLKCCESESYVYYSDTMTSVQGLIVDFYILVFNQDEQNKKEGKKVEKCRISDMKKMYDDSANYPVFEKYFVKDNEESRVIADFIRHYHTLGNYIPVPSGFNRARSGNFINYDMWDLTLVKIKEYYEAIKEGRRIKFDEIECSLLELLHFKDAIVATQAWLDAFGTWENFVDKNYLKASKEEGFDNYVDENYEIDDFFTNIHSFDKPMLMSKEDYLEYFKKITRVIKGRTNLMKKAYFAGGK